MLETEPAFRAESGCQPRLPPATCPAPLTRSQVWVLDARPNSLHGAPDAATREVQHVLSTVQSIQLPLASRDALHQQLKERGLSTGAHLAECAADRWPGTGRKGGALPSAATTTQPPACQPTHRLAGMAACTACRAAAVARQQPGAGWAWPLRVDLQRGGGCGDV